ncbi:MAG TPA: DMT family transporter [Solirubrobacteraceae bacterium]|nr:DMT family transporter [Solirubrobacteraceae bacterium]
MDRTTAAVFVVAAGAAVGAQAPMNGALGRVVGSWQAAFVNFAVGLLILTAIVAIAAGGFGGLRDVPDVPWWALLGGACGVAVVTSSIFAVGHLGAGGVTAAVVAGQLTASVAIDRLGLFGVTRQPLTAGKLLGIALLALGVYLIVRERA